MRTNDEIIDYMVMLKDQQGLSISEIARRVGMAKSAVSRYFNKSREFFPDNKIESFAKALHTTPVELLGLKNSEENKAADKIAKHIDKDMPLQEQEEIIRFIDNGP